MSEVIRVYASLLSTAFALTDEDGVLVTTVPVSAQSVVDRIQAGVDPLSLVGSDAAVSDATPVNLAVGERFKFRTSNPIVVTERAKLAYLVRA